MPCRALHTGFRETAGISLGLYSSAGMLYTNVCEMWPHGSIGKGATSLFGVMWLVLLAAELAIADWFLKARIKHH